MRHGSASLLLLAGICLAACKTTGTAPEAREPAPPPSLLTVDVEALDRSVDPCEDFYLFACGGWMEKNPIPPHKARWARTFDGIDERNRELLREILEQAGQGKLDAPDAEKIGAFWNACMDEEAAEGTLPLLQARLEAIAGETDKTALARRVAIEQLGGAAAFFRFGSTVDYKKASDVIGGADQGGLSLPDRDDYLRDDERSVALRQAFQEHVERMFVLAGSEAAVAREQAATVLAIETALARGSDSRVERRDPYRVYNRIDRPGLEAKAPAFDWGVYFNELGIPEIEKINVLSPGFFAAFNEIWQERPLGELQTYLQWQAIRSATPALGHAFVDEAFRFRSTQISGEKELPPRWRRCLDATDRAIGQALGRIFVERTFGSEGKEQSQHLIAGIERAFGERLDGLDWMDEPTRKEAHEKLKKLANQIGYPQRWRSYEGLEFGTSYLENQTRGAAFEKRRDLAKIGKPVDRNDWFMHPQQVNAYYSAVRNEMVFPAGILQPPFFSVHATEAANAGAIGMVMGHELTHGFDDKGRSFDADGNLRDWWSEASAAAYVEKAQCVERQYSAYAIEPGIHVNGKLTLGENIADIGGLSLAWQAFQQERQGKAEQMVAGFTEAQQFFLSFAQSWCMNRRPELARTLIRTDSHSPPQFRVNGTVSNLPAFQEAFQCEPGSPMAPVDRCEVW